jgi:tRNA uridine 5-carboxymethylaminomethyl modification enzyme
MREVLEKTKVNADMLARIDKHSAISNQHSATLDCHSERSEESAVRNLRSAIGGTLAQLLKRPEIQIESLAPVLRELTPEFFASSAPSAVMSSAERNELKSVETGIKYSGYLEQQERAIERLKKAEQRNIPEWFDYAAVSGLSREMKEKMQHVRPRTLGQASRIPGVTPAAVSLINVYIEIQARRHAQAAALP